MVVGGSIVDFTASVENGNFQVGSFPSLVLDYSISNFFRHCTGMIERKFYKEIV